MKRNNSNKITRKITTPNGEVIEITLYWSRSLGQYVTVPEGE
jgi:hypothetical protein